MSIEKKISYKDKKLTKSQQKKTKPANQGGGPNYLGKQKEVTVPKKWLSSPDHVVAELAYITPREQKILLDADLYGSLKGKPNRGPGGIMSLQGDMGSIGGGSSSGGGGGGGGGDDGDAREQYGAVGQYSTPPSSPPSSPPSGPPSNGDDGDAREQYGAVGQYSTPPSNEDDNSVTGPTGPSELGLTTKGLTTPTGPSELGLTTRGLTTPTGLSELDETTDLDELKTITFAPKEQRTLFQQFVDGIKNIGKNALKAAAVSTGLGALGLSARAISIGNVALGLGKQTGLTKSGSLGELGKNTLGSIGDVFSGNTNSLSGNTNSLSGNTNNSLSNNQNNGGERDQGNADQGDVLASEYILLLQKMQLGNFTQEDQTRFNLLKQMLGK